VKKKSTTSADDLNGYWVKTGRWTEEKKTKEKTRMWEEEDGGEKQLKTSFDGLRKSPQSTPWDQTEKTKRIKGTHRNVHGGRTAQDIMKEKKNQKPGGHITQGRKR